MNRTRRTSPVQPAQPRDGDTVLVQLYDARIITAQVCIGGMLETVSGLKVRVRSANAVRLVDLKQIIKILRKEPLRKGAN